MKIICNLKGQMAQPKYVSYFLKAAKENKNAISHECSTEVLYVSGWLDGSPGGVRYRAPYCANTILWSL